MPLALLPSWCPWHLFVTIYPTIGFSDTNDNFTLVQYHTTLAPEGDEIAEEAVVSSVALMPDILGLLLVLLTIL